jgi:hypothetical protein
MSEPIFPPEVPQKGQKIKITILGGITDVMDGIVEKIERIDDSFFRIYLVENGGSWRIRDIHCVVSPSKVHQKNYDWFATFNGKKRAIFIENQSAFL